MNAEHLSQEQLQRGYDGDLSNQEAAELRRHLSTCPACQAEFDAIGRLGQLVRWAARGAEPSVQPGAAVPHESAGAPDFDRMFAAIQVAIAQPEAAAPDAPIPITRARPQAKPHQPRWLTRAAPALGTIALAAAALLMVMHKDPVATDPNAVATNESDVQITTVNGLRSEVVDYDFGANGGQVFDIPMSDGTPIPVVWIDDDDDDEE